MRGRRSSVLLCALIALALGVFVAACGDDDGGSSGSSGGGATGSEKGSTEGAKKIDLSLKDSAKGTVRYCQGKDTAGEAKDWVKKFNAQNNGVTVELVEFSPDAGQQRQSFVQRQEAKSGDCDMFSSDVIWTAEFASQKWLYDMTEYIESKKDQYIPATLATIQYDGKYWGSPRTSDAAFLYYRTDQVKSAPATWQAVYDEAAKQDGIVYQGAAYEGLTCDFLEIAFAAGGKVLSEDGTKAEFDSPENLKALKFMVDGIKNGAAPKAVTTYMEEEARMAFEAGRATFERNWPYAYAAGKKNKNAPDFKVVPFPEFEGGGKAGILGGHNDVISVYGKNPGGALKVLDYLSSEEEAISLASEFSLAPAIASAYDNAKVKEALPFAAELKQAISQAKPRPVSPVYPQISAAIYKNVNEALSGSVSPEEALKTGQQQIEQALKTF
jgi:trehalose/maltose transport system substrate-binding protein